MQARLSDLIPADKRRDLTRFLSIAVILLSLSAAGPTCIGIAKSTPTPPPSTATPVLPTLTTSTSSVPELPTATPEPQALRFGLPASPQKLDPAVTFDSASDLVSAQLYETLVRFESGTTRVEPALATDWTVSPDGLTWEFKLREDVRFHDGTPLTAQAVVWNFDRWMDPDHPAHRGDFSYWEGMFGGFKEEIDLEAVPQGLVASVEAPGEQTVRLVLNKPFTPVLHNLAMGAFAILSPDAVTSAGVDVYGTAGAPPPIGTGPFRLAEWKEDGMILVTNQDYWGGSPGLSQLTLQIIPDDETRFSALENGEIHGLLSPAETDLSRAQESAEVKVVMDLQPTTAFLNFNLDGKFLGRHELRQAIAHAINKPALVEEAFGPTWVPAMQMLPPGHLGYNESITDYQYDPERARELIDQADLPSGFTVDLWYPDRPRPYLPNPAVVAKAIARDLEAVGIPVTLDTEHWSAYLVDRSQGAFSMWLLGWTSYNGDPDSFFFYHFGLPTPREGNYVNMQLRDLLLRGQVLVDPEAREEIYQQAAAVIHKDVPRLFLAHPQEPILLSSRVIGFTPNPAGPETFFDVRLQPQPES